MNDLNLNRIRRSPVLLMLLAGVYLSPARPANAAEDEVFIPGAPLLLPQDTMAYIRIDNVQEIRSSFGDTSIGRMLDDPKMKPFASEFYATVKDLFSKASNFLGIELEELLDIPQGQVAIALVPRLLAKPDPDQEAREDTDDESDEAIRRRIDHKRRQQYGFAVMVIVDAGEKIETLMKLVEKLDGQLEREGRLRRDQTIDDTKLVRWVPRREGRPAIEYFRREGVFIIGVGDDTAKDALERWTKTNTDPTFANSSDFTSVLSRSVGAEDTFPQVTFYADPYHIVERLVKSQGGAAALAWPLVEELGISKIRGIGGSAFRGGEVFEDITHMHLLIDPPRDGFFGVLRPAVVDTVPPNWVPADVTSYTTFKWDIDTTYENLGKILDKFSGEGSLDRFFQQPVDRRLGMSLRDEILAQLTGRYVGVRWLQPPMAINSSTTTIALQIHDAQASEKVLQQFRDRVPQALRPEVLGGTMTYTVNRGGRGDRSLPKGFRQPKPLIFMLEDWMIFTDSEEMAIRMIRAAGDVMPHLADNLDYELVSGELGGKLSGEQPFLFSYIRSSDFIRQMFELATNPDTHRFFRQAGRKNVVARKFTELLERNELPAFSEFEKYFGVGGVFAYDEPNGMHVGLFNLRPVK